LGNLSLLAVNRVSIVNEVAILLKTVGAVLIFGTLAGCATDLQQVTPPHQDQRWHSPIIDALDVNHDGVIDSNEIANACAALKTLDKNHDGQLSYDETHWTSQPEHESEPEPVIAVLDTHRNDIISSNEIANAAVALKKLDKNGDGKLTPDEYSPPHFVRPVTPEVGQPQVPDFGKQGLGHGPLDNSHAAPTGF
jgi:hypothetical protein